MSTAKGEVAATLAGNNASNAAHLAVEDDPAARELHYGTGDVGQAGGVSARESSSLGDIIVADQFATRFDAQLTCAAR